MAEKPAEEPTAGTPAAEARQAALLSALLTQKTIRDAAKAAGVPERTAYRLLADPAFRSSYRQARRESVEHAISRLQQAAGDAVDTLREVMGDETTPAAVRIAAARVILETSLKAVEVDDLMERLEEVEAMLALLQAPEGRQ